MNDEEFQKQFKRNMALMTRYFRLALIFTILALVVTLLGILGIRP